MRYLGVDVDSLCKYFVESAHPKIKASVKVSSDLIKCLSVSLAESTKGINKVIYLSCLYPLQSDFSKMFSKCVVLPCSERFPLQDFKAKQNPKPLLFPQLARCDTCGHEGKLSQSLAIPGDVKHFCDLKCLLHFCHRKLSTSGASMFYFGLRL